MTPTARSIRRGLPRVRGGEPWPIVAQQPTSLEASNAEPVNTSVHPSPVALRRGLPRVRLGEPWPPAPASGPVLECDVAPAPESQAAPELPEPEATIAVASVPDPSAVPTPTFRTEADAVPQPAAQPKPAVVASPTQNDTAPTDADAARFRGPFTRVQQLVGAGSLIVMGAALIAILLVWVARWLLGLPAVEGFLERYPGTTDLPDHAPVGFPAWLGWQHFLNAFLMILIIRSGWQIRREQKPPAYVTGRRGKMSLTVWFHQSLDALWLLNGVIFTILLFATGQWMRVVPMTWEIFPNALSAMLHYMSLDWPLENGWVNYNSLQVLAYFTTIFIAAPLAMLSGFRMSDFWPKQATRLSRIWSLERARAIHFPVMLYFVGFIIIHVILVFATGALRNLNHMYAAQGSPDPSEYADNWLGLILFAISIMVIIVALLLMRPAIIAGIVRPFGKVSSR